MAEACISTALRRGSLVSWRYHVHTRDMVRDDRKARTSYIGSDDSIFQSTETSMV